ncbi:DUF2231 domain-containing protein [Mycolicibacterium duvalii]|uniref:Membrane protein n=1 Tax=Mycolicibacterium duvalii TaxID=39688 RepID=A0A7I7JXS7_9MYCO|nr:DUF2231 domain-containing protein [Mycolicibacterium duvalii]MCV7369987.1 DUF2231 domain-containing protein [Mycolicibacterium duvalii]PEG34858.1 DUF2231 domain-containing protein [Mycolicibacterium duvalii]BBX15912.1 membrane protein [Mycolicibacterium duvalii]
MNVHSLLRSAESVRALDPPADRAAETVERVLGGRAVGRALRGSWLGHPVHPLLVFLPLGSWMTALLFDIGLRDRTTARRLLAVGLAAAPPTALAGWAEFPLLNREQRRVGLLHAVVNGVAIGLFALAYRAHGKEHHRRATVLTVLALLIVSVGGSLGGHLSYAQGAGVHRWQAPHHGGDLASYALGRAA